MHPTHDPLDVIDAIRTTVAQRRLRTDPVPEAIIWSLLDAAIHGPSSGNGQRWSWIVVIDDAIKAPIARLYLSAWNELHRGRRARMRQLAARVSGAKDPSAAALAEARRDPNYRAGEHLAMNIGRAPVWIFAVINGVRASPTVADGADIFGAVQNLMLAARAHGLGSTITMLHRRNESAVASILGLPADSRALALIPMGYPTSGRFFETRRKPAESVTYWDRWGATRRRPGGESGAATGPRVSVPGEGPSPTASGQ
jgi:nitroreductase